MVFANEIVLAPTSQPLTAICIIHCATSIADDLIEAVKSQFVGDALEFVGVKSLALLRAVSGDRIAIYLQFNGPDDCSNFLASSAVKQAYSLIEKHGAVGQFHAYAIPYVKDSTTGQICHFHMGYRGVRAINEVTVNEVESQGRLTALMIRTDSVAQRLPFHHSTNIHVASDGSFNLNILQFRFSIVRVIVWFILRFGRPAEALKFGQPDIRFYTLQACWQPR
jgi:hypothetical protein